MFINLPGNYSFRLLSKAKAHGSWVGIVSKSAAILMAEEAELDLVILSPEADPPVVKLMDYNYNIDVHDYSVRLKAAQKFLKNGKANSKLKGSENEFKNNAIELIRRFRDDVGELAVEESKNFRDRNMTLVLVPNKAVLQKEAPKKTAKSTETQVSASV
ncbi:hypothetical protein L1987_14332 [Smallanthus sonchifolius]|uniref:Uncharacterized protein n=1 Tax=Smallanthus sonchifolius TaxID=185202 RepID=A0ACB9J2L9_9ASTR|nr:hypothetical protein L1987_14332 [Smallanthus sonchifolius]